MYNYSIVSLNHDRVEAVCEDILRQYRDGIADCALFCMTLVPEGHVDKAGNMAKQYVRYRDYLAERGAECGILVQASIGHGWKLNQPFPFQPYVNFSDGQELGTVCPWDPDFRNFFRGQMHTVAACKPKTIMLDDDFRLLHKPGQGCACPRHMAEFNRRAGTHYTREELWELVHQDTEEACRCREIFIGTQKDALIDAAKAYRAGIDEVDPKLPGSYCTVLGECAGEIAKIMAGEGNPVILRVNNGSYTAEGPRFLSGRWLIAAYQMATFDGHCDAFLAETDTCPQNRYSTSAQHLHAHFTGTILEGASGAKHWITRLGAYEPKSGEAYRRKLSKYSGFYHALAALVPRLEPVGCRIPLPKQWSFHYDAEPYGKIPMGFATGLLERMGLPVYYSPENGGVACLDGDADREFSDDALRQMLRGTVMLDCVAVRRLNARGFGAYLGVDARPWQGKPTSGERLPNGNRVALQYRDQELVPTDPATYADSWVFHIPDGESTVDLFPGVTVFENALGGRVIAFCGTPDMPYNIVDAFGFLNESRKAQLIGLLDAALPVYYPEDAEVYLRAAKLPDGSLFCAVFDLGTDWLEDLPLVTKTPVSQVQRMDENGEWQPCTFSVSEEGIRIDSEVRTLDPAIFRLVPAQDSRF